MAAKLKRDNVCDHPKALHTHEAFMLKTITRIRSERLKDVWKVDLGAFSIMASAVVKGKSGSQRSILWEIVFPRRHLGFAAARHAS